MKRETWYSRGMWRFVTIRLAQAVPPLLGVLALTFVLFNVVAESPAEVAWGKSASAQAKAEYNQVHGYDQPLYRQFVRYVGNVVWGDLGESIEYRVPVTSILKEGVGVSLSLTLPILILGTVMALVIGLVCAAFRGGIFDRAALFAATALMSVNYVIWVVAGQYLLAYHWRLFPIWGYESWAYLALPVVIGIVSGLSQDVRFYRTIILDEVSRPYVRTAIAKGLHPVAVLFRHVLRNSLIPVITTVSLAIPFLFTGSVLLEGFFGIPGLGGIGLNAVHASDVTMVRAVVLIGAALYQAAAIAADILTAAADPRVRLA